MRKLSNSDILLSIHNGEEEILLYLSDRYFPAARKWLRRKGVADKQTPVYFRNTLLKVYREIQASPLTSNLDFESYFYNSLKETKKSKEGLPDIAVDSEKGIVVACYHVLDDQSRALLNARYCEKLSFEEIASKFEFTNPVIAEFEVNKAMMQLESIVKARLYPSVV